MTAGALKGTSEHSPECLTAGVTYEKGDYGVDVEKVLKYLGLWKFAGAVMYVLHEVIGLSEEKMIVPMDKKRGKLLLAEILSGGNFGQYDERHDFGHSSFGHNIQRLCRDLRLMRYYPAEALSEPIFRTWHFFWRMKNKKKIDTRKNGSLSHFFELLFGGGA